MILWLDAQLSPALASWITAQFVPIQAVPVKELGLRDQAITSLRDGDPGSKFAHHAESPALPATRGSRLLLYRCAEAFGYMQEQRQRGGATYESHEDEPIVLVAERRFAGGCTGRSRRHSCR